MSPRLFATTALAAALIATTANAASFDCTKAATPVEHMICASPELSQLDEQTALAYAAKRNAAPNSDAKTAIIKAGRAWLKQRNLCPSESCIAASYRERIGELGAVASAAPAAQPNAPGPSASTQAQQAEQALAPVTGAPSDDEATAAAQKAAADQAAAERAKVEAEQDAADKAKAEADFTEQQRRTEIVNEKDAERTKAVYGKWLATRLSGLAESKASSAAFPGCSDEFLNAKLFPSRQLGDSELQDFSARAMAYSLTPKSYFGIVLVGMQAAKISCFKPDNNSGHGMSIKVPGSESQQTVFNQEGDELYPISYGLGGRIAAIDNQTQFLQTQLAGMTTLIQFELNHEADAQPLNTFSEAMTASDDDRAAITAADALNDKCRGGSGDEQATQAACDARTKAYNQLKIRGWCYGPELVTGANQHWLRCDKDGNPLPH